MGYSHAINASINAATNAIIDVAMNATDCIATNLLLQCLQNFLKLFVVESIAAFLPEMSAIDCNALPISTSIYYHKYVVDINMQCESFGIISATINIIYVNI